MTNGELWAQQHPELAKVSGATRAANLASQTPRKRKAVPVQLKKAQRAGDVIVVPLPLPPSELQSNVAVGLHWAVKGKAAKTARTIAQFVASGARPSKPFERARIDVTFWRQKKLDPNNVWAYLKHTIDGLQDAGLFVNDRDLETGNVTQHTGKAAGERREVELVITRLDS